MVGTAEGAGGIGTVARFGLKPGQAVQEFGYDADVDHELRDAIEDAVGADLLDEDADDMVEVVVLWWRDGDGDLVDTLVDTLGSLVAGGTVWLLTPKAGRDGHVDAADVEEAAPSVGLNVTKTISAGEDWTGIRLVQPKGERRS
ncbi:MAG: DUF3052 domain-containing protein [Actinomycetales bacterium]